MAREIKFRGKKFCQDEWIYGSLITRGERGADGNFIDTGRGKCYPLQQDTIGQFTGLHDKNGKEIYEGDIVRTLVSRLNATKNKKYRNFVIRYDAPHFWNGYDPMLMGPMYMEVIGNIYDNPELLKQEDEV